MAPASKMEGFTKKITRRMWFQIIIILFSIGAGVISFIIILQSAPAWESHRVVENLLLEKNINDLLLEQHKIKRDILNIREEIKRLRRDVSVLDKTQEEFMTGTEEITGGNVGYAERSRYKELLSEVNELTGKVDEIENEKLKRVEEDTNAIKTVIGGDPLASVSVIILNKDLENFKEVHKTELYALETRVEKYHASIYWILGIISFAVVGSLIQGFMQLGVQIRRGRGQE